MTYRNTITIKTLGFLVSVIFISGCGQAKIVVGTGTQIGLEASPGDGQTRAPSVSFAYKRGEIALVPVAESSQGNEQPTDDSQTAVAGKEDAYSTLATFNMAHNWFGPTKIEQFFATGHAAREIQKGGSSFAQELADDKP